MEFWLIECRSAGQVSPTLAAAAAAAAHFINGALNSACSVAAASFFPQDGKVAR